MKKIKNTKGSLMDSIFMPMFIMVMIMTSFIAYYIWGEFSSTMGTMASNTAINETTNMSSVINPVLADIQISFNSIDYMIPFIVGGLLVISLIFAFRTGASVLFSFLSVIFWGLALLLSVVFTNIFDQFSQSFPTVAANFPIAVYVMNNMKWISLGWAFLISVVMFTRNKNEDRQLAAQEAFVG